MRLLFILTFLTTVSCNIGTEKQNLINSLTEEKFRTRPELTIEFIDSTFFVALSGVESIHGIRLGTWRVENNISGIYLFLDSTNSSGFKLETITDSIITFNYGEFRPKFSKTIKKEGVDITGSWVCLECDSLPSINKNDDLRYPTYTFDSSGHFEITEEDYKLNGQWRLSGSQELILLNDVYKPTNILLIENFNEEKLTVKRLDDLGVVIERKLKRSIN